MAFLRKSKYRHVFGQALKKDQCWDGIRITKNSWESPYCAVSAKYVAIITEAAGGGSFIVLPIVKPATVLSRIQMNHPLISGHKGAVLDISWCPHNDDVIASASDDCTVKVWQIPEGGVTETITTPVVTLASHQRRVTLLVWHPTAMNVLLSASSDNTMILWNVGTEEGMLQIDMPDQIYSGSFNLDGSKFVCTCKDKMLRVVDTHSGEVLQEGKAHAGSKPAQACYLKDGLIFTTGFSRLSERQYALWNEKDLSAPKNMEEIDSSNGVLFIFYDPDSSMVYLAGKGDSLIRYYEITAQDPYVHFLTLYQSNAPQRGIGYLPKRAVNVNTNEIARFYKIHNNGFCEVIPFTVPRKSDLFQDDLYPETASDQPAISADEFFEGKNSKPLTMSMEGGFKSTRKEQLKVVRKSNVLDKAKAPPAASAAKTTGNSAEAAAAPALPVSQAKSVEAVSNGGVDVQELMKGLEELRSTVKSQEERITQLEGKLASLEANQDSSGSEKGKENEEEDAE